MHAAGADGAMPGRMIDKFGRDGALHRHGLPLCLHLPIAAVDEDSIGAHVPARQPWGSIFDLPFFEPLRGCPTAAPMVAPARG